MSEMIRPITITIEKDKSDGLFVVYESGIGIYGTGQTIAAAIETYLLMRAEYFQRKATDE